MADMSKHRLESYRHVRQFEDALDDGDQINTIDAVRVFREKRGAWQDVSAEFGIADPTTEGTKVESDKSVRFQLGAADDPDEQRTDYEYIVRIDVSTANGEELVGRVSLQVTGEADPEAP